MFAQPSIHTHKYTHNHSNDIVKFKFCSFTSAWSRTVSKWSLMMMLLAASAVLVYASVHVSASRDYANRARFRELKKEIRPSTTRTTTAEYRCGDRTPHHPRCGSDVRARVLVTLTSCRLFDRTHRSFAGSFRRRCRPSSNASIVVGVVVVYSTHLLCLCTRMHAHVTYTRRTIDNLICRRLCATLTGGNWKKRDDTCVDRSDKEPASRTAECLLRHRLLVRCRIDS